jgi:hypothetical protein
MVVTPQGRVLVTAAAADLLSDVIGKDERLTGTSYELEYRWLPVSPTAS